jgi:hypothetical protein
LSDRKLRVPAALIANGGSAEPPKVTMDERSRCAWQLEPFEKERLPMQFITVTPPTPVTPDPPVLTRYQQVANEVFADLQAIRAKIPELELPTPETRKFVRAMHSVPRAFMDSAVGQVQQIPEYQAVNRLDIQNAQNSLQLIDGLGPLSDALRTLLTSVDHTIDVHYARVANSSLQMYQIAKGLARDFNASHIGTSVKILGEKLGRLGGHRQSKTDTGTNTGTVPPAVPTPTHTTTMLIDDGIVITGKVSKMDH